MSGVSAESAPRRALTQTFPIQAPQRPRPLRATGQREVLRDGQMASTTAFSANGSRAQDAAMCRNRAIRIHRRTSAPRPPIQEFIGAFHTQTRHPIGDHRPSFDILWRIRYRLQPAFFILAEYAWPTTQAAIKSRSLLLGTKAPGNFRNGKLRSAWKMLRWRITRSISLFLWAIIFRVTAFNRRRTNRSSRSAGRTATTTYQSDGGGSEHHATKQMVAAAVFQQPATPRG